MTSLFPFDAGTGRYRPAINARSGILRTNRPSSCELQLAAKTCALCTRNSRRLRCQAFLGAATSLPTAASGWLIAATVLAAVRLGRKQAEDERVSQLQGMSQSAIEAEIQELVRRRAGEMSQSLQAAEAAAQRLQEARRRAAEQEKALQEDNQRLLEAASKAQQLAEAARAKERQAYEAREAELRAELERRSELERQIRAEKLAAARAEEERLRQEAEERRRLLELERQRQEEERQAALRAEREARAAEKREIQRLAQKFTLSLEGTVRLAIPEEGTQTEGRLPRDALLEMEITAGSLVGGSAVSGPVPFESVEAAQERLDFQLASAAALAAQQYAAAARLQKLMEQGPLTRMSESELTYWMRCAGVRTAVVAAPGATAILAQFADRRKELQHGFQSRTVRGVLPDGDARQTAAILRRASAAIEAGDPATARAILLDFAADEEELLSQEGPQVPQHTGAALALAFFLDQMLEERPPRQVGASPWYEEACNLAAQLLKETVAGAPEDSLSSAAALVAAVVPRDHTIARCMERLELSNRSAKTRSALKQREELLQAELAERLVEFEWPDREQLAAARQEAAEASTPLPERIWALRNVGATLGIGGPGERARARTLLERAVTLKRELVGSRRHPGMLPELDALATLLEAEPEWRAEAAGIRDSMLGILASIAEAYISKGDVASAVALLDGAVREYEELLGFKNAAVLSATKRWNNLFDTLPEEQKAKVVAARKRGGLVARVVRSFEEEVASRQTPGSMQQHESWNEAGIDWLGSLV